jgi:hypothetical protein
MRVQMLELDLLDARADARAVDADKVRAIAASVGDVGLLNPIRVRPAPGAEGRYEIVAGAHRVAAYRGLGLVEIEADVVDSGDLFAELAMIDENLCRAELGPADRARQVARRKAIYEELHPETQHGSPGVSRQVGDTRERSESERFTADTAAATGASERTVQREAERGEKISPDVLELVRGTELDTGKYLDGLKKFAPDQQRMLVERDLAALADGDELDAGAARARRAVGAGRVQDGDSLDFFPTPPWATRALVEVVLQGRLGLNLDWDLVWEPACGEGHISGVLEEYGLQVVATDIADYSVDGRFPPGWDQQADFLTADWSEAAPPEWIITNPPFTGRDQDRALEFALKALSIATVGVALFVRTGWVMEGIGRYERLFRDQPATLICPFVERVPVHEGRWEPDGSSDMAYCWVVWVKGALPGPLFRIPPGQRKALTRDDDVARFTAHPCLPPDTSSQLVEDVPFSRPAGDESLTSSAGTEGEADRRHIPSSTAARMDVLDNSTEGGGLAEPLDQAAALSADSWPPAGTQAPPVEAHSNHPEIPDGSAAAADINEIILAGYARNAPLSEIAETTGLTKRAVQKRAKRLDLTSADRQRAAVAEANRRRKGGAA